LFKHAAPLTGVEALERNHHAVIHDAAGSIWDVSPRGETRKLREGDGVAITILRASASGHYVAVGTATGVVTVYETSSWHVIKAIQSAGSIRQIQFDPMDRDLIFISEAGRAQHGHVRIVALGSQRTLRWQEVTAAARDVAYSPDGATVGFVCADGGTWLYSFHGDSWAYTRDHETDTFTARFSPDGKLFASTDRSGVVVVRNVNQRTQ
jgi:WD40 repeat protein